MLERTKRISFRISSVSSKVEPEPGAGPSHRLRTPNKKYQLRPAPAPQHWQKMFQIRPDPDPQHLPLHAIS